MAQISFGLDKKKLLIIIGIVIVAIGIIIGSVFGVKAIIKNKEKKNINYYEATFYFIDDQYEKVPDVIATLNGNAIAKSDETGKLKLENIPENSTITFSINEYDFAAGEDTFLITKDVKLQFIYVTRNSNYIPVEKPNNFTIYLQDENSLPLKNAIIFIDNKRAGTSNSKGIFTTRVDKTTVSIKVQLKYYSFDEKNYSIQVDDNNVEYIQGKFNSQDYFAKVGATLSDGSVVEVENTYLSCTYKFIKEDGTQFSSYSITYKDASGTFHAKNYYNIYDVLSFEQMKETDLFTDLYCYLYDSQTSTWYSSGILSPTTCSGSIVMKKAYCVKVNYTANSTVYTSNGLFFNSDDEGVVSIVLSSFTDIVFYKDYIGNNLMYPLKVYDSTNKEIIINPENDQTLYFK